MSALILLCVGLYRRITMYSSIELFAGAGGLALGIEKARLNTLGLDKGRLDLLTGGAPCQAFSYAGYIIAKKLLKEFWELV